MPLSAQESNTDSLESHHIEYNFPISNVPAGTHMVIPEFIVQEYRETNNEWGLNLSEYWSHYYSIARPSLLKKGMDTFFVPLRPVDKVKEIMMVDLMNVRFDEENNHYITIENSPYYISAENEEKSMAELAKQQ